jgi:hypothetical protein
MNWKMVKYLRIIKKAEACLSFVLLFFSLRTEKIINKNEFCKVRKLHAEKKQRMKK